MWGPFPLGGRSYVIGFGPAHNTGQAVARVGADAPAKGAGGRMPGTQAPRAG